VLHIITWIYELFAIMVLVGLYKLMFDIFRVYLWTGWVWSLKARCRVFQSRLQWTSVFSQALKRNLAQIRAIVFEKNVKNDVTEPKATLKIVNVSFSNHYKFDDTGPAFL